MRFVFRLASCWVNDWETGLSDIDCLLFRWLVYHHASHHTTVWSQSHSILTLKEQHAEYTTEHVELAFNDRPDDRRCMHHDNSVSVLLAIHLCFRLLLQFRTYRDSGGFFVTTVSVFRSGEKCHQHASSLSSIHWPAPKSHHRILRFCYHSNKTRCWNLGVGQFVWTGVSFHAESGHSEGDDHEHLSLKMSQLTFPYVPNLISSMLFRDVLVILADSPTLNLPPWKLAGFVGSIWWKLFRTDFDSFWQMTMMSTSNVFNKHRDIPGKHWNLENMASTEPRTIETSATFHPCKMELGEDIEYFNNEKVSDVGEFISRKLINRKNDSKLWQCYHHQLLLSCRNLMPNWIFLTFKYLTFQRVHQSRLKFLSWLCIDQITIMPLPNRCKRASLHSMSW